MATKKHRDNWQFLHPWFKPIWLKLLIPWFALIPILLTVFRDVPQVIRIGSVDVVALNFELPFKWWLLWIASFAYALAFAIYAARCPKFITRYPTYRDYQAQGHSPRWMAWELNHAVDKAHSDKSKQKLFKRLVDKKLVTEIAPVSEATPNPQVSDRGSIYRFEYDGRWYEFVGSEKSNNSETIDCEVFWEILGPLASSRPGWRQATWYLLYVSGALLVIAVCQNVWVVLKYLAQSLLTLCACI
jgi:hypothetical protein